MACWGVIGGSGLDGWDDLIWTDEVVVATPYGEPSAALRLGQIEKRAQSPTKVIYLPRHGPGHCYAPHRINYRANLWALKQAGVQQILATATVGSIASTIQAGSICVPDQLIDYTWGREQSYSEDGQVLHIDFTHPFDPALRAALIQAGQDLPSSAGFHEHGTYGCTQGPRLETAAEIVRLAKDGCSLVGMTAMPEAALARELGLPYALLCLAVNPAAGVGQSAAAVDHDDLKQVMSSGMHQVKAILLKTMQGKPA
ncbi:MAG: S-methyl-5'-thioinosine phosphorylase [Betaproteobacteria bacterium]|jgi:5'-methylthioinosine phosphorylase|nr:S-methyl-5'-thioinosine phosphorylase [Pseudomonadota bacterium]NBO04593.1 S-methyl-5'-thioinosine phosphorylase [Betaproteobacteria bacterium]NBO95705.1 S-methyl-5'-thioinosine phosphorylase [Betaproteobacteria bacterium]NBP34863.1 S-methyl-5'-thioinosine phosphorylase [Betaproteobacteria bacterium]NBP37533.1 S-methyl-5'-thioinosine phosphorylase [Betaproteobacteria bacterium]